MGYSGRDSDDMKIRILSAVLIVFFLGVGVFLRHRLAAPRLQGIEEARIYAEQILGSKSPKEAYELFKKRYATVPIADAHVASHAFGEALYAKAGVDGFSVCDATFGFGCFHTFIPAAIADKGTEVIREFDQSCVKVFGPVSLGCFHGIGHGLLAYEGYTQEGVQKSLTLCKSLSWKHIYGGCPEGVFMEYDFRTTIPDTSKQLRPFSEDEKYLPCSAVDQASRVDCYFSIPSWWGAALRGNAERYTIMGRYCASVIAPDQRRACYRGIGYEIAPTTNFRVEPGIRACDSAQKGGVECREGLAWALYADPTFRPEAEKACTTDLSTALSAVCIRDYLFILK